MFNTIKIKKIKGLESCVLRNLGRINVICGKNNSGKSTLLEGINSSDHRGILLNLSSDKTKTFYDKSINRTPWDGRQENLNNLYETIINDSFNSREEWFSNESDIFIESIIEYSKKYVPFKKTFTLNEGFLKTSYHEIFPEVPKTILIPAKRRLEENKNVHSKDTLNEEGKGILNYFFYAKNQPEDTEDNSIFTEINKAFYDISSGYEFDIFFEENENVDDFIQLKFKYKEKNWIDAGDCGLGLQDLLIILYFSISPDYEVILIEEPENHMHPDMQRKLLIYLKNHATDKQFFLTTHSNIFLNNSLVDKIIYTYFEDSVKVDDATSKVSILNDLGYTVTDNLVSDLIILVEGPKDRPIIEEFMLKMGILKKYDIKIWPLGGDIMNQVDLSVFAEKYKIIALIDKDIQSRKIRDRFIENCNKYSIPVHKLKRYAIENYFTIDALRNVYGSEINEEISKIKTNVKLEAQLGFNVKKKNREIVKQMSLDDIKSTDFYEWLEKIPGYCSNSIGSTENK